MALLQAAAEKNECRELIEVPMGSEWRIRRLQREFPCYLWKFSEGQTVPGYVVTIAKKLEEEFGNSENLPVGFGNPRFVILAVLRPICTRTSISECWNTACQLTWLSNRKDLTK